MFFEQWVNGSFFKQSPQTGINRNETPITHNMFNTSVKYDLTP
jgi:hypothetical protein